MLVKEENRAGVAGEIRIVPAWAWGLAGIVFVAAQIFFNGPLAHQTNAPAPWVRALLGLLAGIGGAIFVLLIGYINRDAKRRGMSPVLWTIVALIIPNALGIILYFILRQSLQSVCPKCGNAVQVGFSYCPRCSCKLNPSCPQCQRVVGLNDLYCPYCGASLQNQAAPVLSQPTNLPG